MQVLQLKITLKDSRPPIWRRLLIRPDATFWDLHSAIQDLFGWEDCHLHSFERAWKRNDDRHFFEVPHPDSFGDMKSELAAEMFGPGIPRDYFHDERKEKLADWITKEQPKYLYTYDFGDNWEHEISLEKIFEVPELKFAKYLGGKRQGMQEDSGSFAMLDCTTIIKAAKKPSGELWRAITKDMGKARAQKLLARAQKEAASSAPVRVQFSDPGKRYKEAKAIGMFE